MNKSGKVTLIALSFLVIVSSLIIWRMVDYIEDLKIKILSASNQSFLFVEDFGADGSDWVPDSQSIQAAIDYSAANNQQTVELSGNRTYIVDKTILLKEGVSLKLAKTARLVVVEDVTVIELEQDTSIINATIEISTPTFNSDVLHVSGNQQIWTTNSIFIHNVVLYNPTESKEGTGIHFSAENEGEFISFVNVANVTISGFHTGLQFTATKPNSSKDKFNFINGNRFENITLENCSVCIKIESNSSIPNEVSGNTFENLQIQLAGYTKNVLEISGSYNVFEAMIWDVQLLDENQPIIKFSENAANTSVITNLSKDYVTDNGYLNEYHTRPASVE